MRVETSLNALAIGAGRASLSGMRNRCRVFGLLLGLGYGAVSCSAVQMPFRVVGSMAKHSYTAGEKAVKASSQAREERKQKEEAAKKAQDQAKAPGPAQPAAALPPEAGGGSQVAAPEFAPQPLPPPLPGADPATLPPLPDNQPPPAGR